MTGAVRSPGTVLSTAELNSSAQGPVHVHYATNRCRRLDAVHGVLLHNLLTDIGLALHEAPKMDQLTFVVLAHGEDGYEVLLSWAELDPEFGSCGALLATRYNNELLPRPTLVMPRDGRGSRYVRLVNRLHVLRIPPIPTQR
ncbi:molybdopterin-binding protein [Saccharopolyspora sp. NPDC050389]|uniref:molybdopterin-binding protein n=1 Tax=Saccharopolyspora sp. NPDC050389 TaxID=3155516 RepID=UPI0033E67045